jgi:predicted transcriptional regulator
VETPAVKRRKSIGSEGEEAPSLGVLEGDILRLLWDAGEPQSSVQVYEAMHFSRRAQNREIPSPSTIAVMLSRMVEKGLLSVERPHRRRSGKAYYRPTQARGEILARVMNEASRRLTGQSLGYILSLLRSEQRGTGRQDAKAAADGLEEVITELKRRMREDSTMLPRPRIPALEE